MNSTKLLFDVYLIVWALVLTVSISGVKNSPKRRELLRGMFIPDLLYIFLWIFIIFYGLRSETFGSLGSIVDRLVYLYNVTEICLLILIFLGSIISLILIAVDFVRRMIRVKKKQELILNRKYNDCFWNELEMLYPDTKDSYF